LQHLRSCAGVRLRSQARSRGASRARSRSRSAARAPSLAATRSASADRRSAGCGERLRAGRGRAGERDGGGVRLRAAQRRQRVEAVPASAALLGTSRRATAAAQQLLLGAWI